MPSHSQTHIPSPTPLPAAAAADQAIPVKRTMWCLNFEVTTQQHSTDTPLLPDTARDTLEQSSALNTCLAGNLTRSHKPVKSVTEEASPVPQREKAAVSHCTTLFTTILHFFNAQNSL